MSRSQPSFQESWVNCILIGNNKAPLHTTIFIRLLCPLHRKKLLLGGASSPHLHCCRRYTYQQHHNYCFCKYIFPSGTIHDIILVMFFIVIMEHFIAAAKNCSNTHKWVLTIDTRDRSETMLFFCFTKINKKEWTSKTGKTCYWVYYRDPIFY